MTNHPTTHRIEITPTCVATVTIRPLEAHELTSDGYAGVRCQVYASATDDSWSCDYSARQVSAVVLHSDRVLGYRFDVVDPVGMNAASMADVLGRALDLRMSATDNLVSGSGQDASCVQTVCMLVGGQDVVPAAPAYPERLSGTETVDVAGVRLTISDARICGRCERPLAPYAVDDRARYPYRAGDRCACDDPQPMVIDAGCSVLDMITRNRAGTLSRPVVASDLTYGYALGDSARAYPLRAVTRSLIAANVRMNRACVDAGRDHPITPSWQTAYVRELARLCDTGLAHGPGRETGDGSTYDRAYAVISGKLGSDAALDWVQNRTGDRRDAALDRFHAIWTESYWRSDVTVESIMATVDREQALDGYDLDSFVEGFVTAALWSDCMPPAPVCTECGGEIVESGGGTDYVHVDDADAETSIHDHPAFIDDDYTDDLGGGENLTLDDAGETIVRAFCARFVAANRADLDAYAEQLGSWSGSDTVKGSDAHYTAEERAGADLYLTACGHGVGFKDRCTEGLDEELGDRLTAACRAVEDVSGGLSMIDNGDGTASLMSPSAYEPRR